MAAFAFTEAQTVAIRAPLLDAGLAAGAVGNFLEWSAYTVAAWQGAWPLVDPDKGKANYERLKKLHKTIKTLRYDLNTLDMDWLKPIMADIEWPADLDVGKRSERLALFIYNLEKHFEAAVDHYSLEWGVNGRGNSRKVDLVNRLAWDYHRAFLSKPTTTPSSPFMAAAQAIGDAVGETIGKDTVASAVRAWRNAHTVLHNPQDL